MSIRGLVKPALSGPWGTAAALLPVFLACAIGADRFVFAARASLVLIPVTVVGSRGETVNGLQRDVFSVFEDKAARPIAAFSEEDEPVSLGIVFDASGSMRTALPSAKAALRALFNECNPDDEAFVHLVSTRPAELSGFTSDLGGLAERVLTEGAGGDTALVDTIFAAFRKLGSAKWKRRAIVVISDGMDNHSRRSIGELMSVAAEADAQVYTLSIAPSTAGLKAVEIGEQSKGIAFLSDLSRRTGGFSLVVRGKQEIASGAARIGHALRDRYVIGYIPAAGQDGRWHSICVNVSIPGARVYARNRYRAE